MSAVAAPPVAPSRIVAEREVDRQVARSVVWQAAKMGVQVVQYVVLARLVLPAEYGKFALVLPVLALFTALNDGGLSTAAVTNRRYDERLASDLYLTQLGLAIVMAAGMALIAPGLALAYGVPDLRTIGLWLALCLIAGVWGLQPQARLRRQLRVRALALVEIAGVLAGLAAALCVARVSSGVAVLIAAQLTTVAVTAAAAAVLAPVPLRRFRGTEVYRHALEVGRHMVATNVLNAVRNQFPALAIGFFVVLHDVGLFSRAYQLLSLPLLVLAPALTNFLLPLLARAGAHPEESGRHVRRILRLLLGATIPGCVWVAFGPDDLLAAVLGEEWRAVMPILGGLSPLFIVQIIAVVATITLVSAERSRTVRRFALCNFVICVGAVLLAAPFGVMAVAFALSLSGLLISAPLVVRFALRERTLAPGDVRAAVGLVIALAATTAAALGLLRLVPLAPLMGEIAGLILAAVISAAVLFHTVRRGGGATSP